MRWRNVSLIFRREVLDQLRDRRTLFMLAVLPILLYPMLGIGMVQMTVLFTEQPRTVVILGAADLPSQPLLEGNQFSSRWFRSSADAAKLRVITDLDNPAPEASAVPAAHQGPPATAMEEKTSPATKESLIDSKQRLVNARELRDQVLARQKLELELAAAQTDHHAAQIAAIEQKLKVLNARLTAAFDRSGIQVLIQIPTGFGKNLEQRQADLIPTEGARETRPDYPRPWIVENSADEKSAIAFRRVHEVLHLWERAILKEHLLQSRLPATLSTPINPTEIDLAEMEQVSANTWAKLFPALLVIMTLTGAFYPAVDLCAGEKERGTMETLLICPASRTEIVLGKFFTVLLFSISTALLNLVSVGFTGKYMASLAMSGVASRIGDISLPPLSALVWVFVMLIPLASLFSALCLALATFAKSSKEGQYYLTPLLMVTLGLTIFCLSPATEMHPFYSVMPVIGPGLLLKGLLKSTGPSGDMYLYVVPVLVTSIGYSLLALWWAIEQFSSEEVLFREAERFDLRSWFKHLLRDKEPTPTFAEAGFCFLLIMLLQFASWKSFQSAMQNTPQSDRSLFQVQVLMIQQLALIATPALIMGVILTTSLRQTFSLRWPGFGRLLCAAILPLTLHPLSTELVMSLEWFFPPAPQGLAELMKLLSTNDVPLWIMILAFAVTPGICEELAFRGFLLAGFRRGRRTSVAILLSSCAFGVIHMLPHQVFNATLLGLILGGMCVRNRSLLPGIAFHMVYNTLGVLHQRYGKQVPIEGAWGFLFRSEEGGLRYQPALLCLLTLLAFGLLRRLLSPSLLPDPLEPQREPEMSTRDAPRSLK